MMMRRGIGCVMELEGRGGFLAGWMGKVVRL